MKCKYNNFGGYMQKSIEKSREKVGKYVKYVNHILSSEG